MHVKFPQQRPQIICAATWLCSEHWGAPAQRCALMHSPWLPPAACCYCTLTCSTIFSVCWVTAAARGIGARCTMLQSRQLPGPATARLQGHQLLACAADIHQHSLTLVQASQQLHSLKPCKQLGRSLQGEMTMVMQDAVRARHLHHCNWPDAWQHRGPQAMRLCFLACQRTHHRPGGAASLTHLSMHRQ